MTHITLLACPDSSTSTIAGPIDAFSSANLWERIAGKSRNEPVSDIFSWDIVTLDGRPVEGCGGMNVQPTRSIHDLDRTDVILVPGFHPPLSFLGNVPEPIHRWLHHWHDNNVIIGTICTGTFYLAETGLLDGRTATTHWAFAGFFKKRYPQVHLKPDRILTVDRNLICSGATLAFMDLCLYLIETFGSKELASRCAKGMLMESNRRFQSPYCVFNSQKDHTDRKILNAQEFMEEHFKEGVTIDAIAENHGISPRHFKRRFKKATGDSPLTYLQRLRIETAKELLEATPSTVNEITWQVGYENSNSFRKLFRKHVGLSPREYRARFNRSFADVK